MIRTLDFNSLPAGTVVDDEFTVSDCVTVSASGGSNQAMIFDSSADPATFTGEDSDLLSDTLGGVLIISEDGDEDDPDDNADGGSIFFDFDDLVRIKSLTFKDIEEVPGGSGTRLFFYDDEGNVIEEQFVSPTGAGGESTVGLNVPGVARLEVRIEGSGAIDNLVWEDDKEPDTGPTAVDDAAIVDEDDSVVIDLRGNDTDPNNTNDELTIGSFISADGIVVDNGDGTVTFTPDENFNGETSFSYIVTDPDGNSDTGEVAVTVNPVNDDPIANPDEGDTVSGEPVIIDLRSNDTDVETPTEDLIITPLDNPDGSIVDNGDGTITFTPDPTFVGETIIEYRLTDPDGGTATGTATVTVTEPADEGPTAVPDFETTEEDTSVIVDLVGNDTDPNNTNDELVLTAVSVSPDEGTVEDLGDGTVRFTPAQDFNGEATISYAIEDPDGNSDDGTAFVTVTPVNDAPVANDDSDETGEETPITVNLIANDTDVDQPAGVPLEVVAADVPAEQGTLVNNGDGTVTFTPADDFTGVATISYTIEDADGAQSSAEHTIEVGNENDGPIANPDIIVTDEDTPSDPVNVLDNDEDPDGDPLVLIEADSPDGGVTFTEDGDVVFTPDPDFNGETTITYVVRDPSGETATGTVTVTVNPVNDTPVANDDVDVTAEDEAITVDLLDNDFDVDGDMLTVTSVSVPAEQGTIVNNEDGTATFTPAPDFNGEVTISYSIRDEEGLTDSAEHTVYVNAVSDGPTAVDDEATTPEDTPITIDVLENDTDPDGDPLIIRDADVPEEQGTVEIVENELVFTPAPDFNGPVTITYTVQDPDGNTDEGEVLVDVSPVNDAPVAEDDSDVTDLDTAVTVNLLANDSDVDGDTLTVTAASVPAEQGTLGEVQPDGSVVFTPATGFTGDATITYSIRDEEGLTDDAVHVINVSDPDDAPNAVDDTATTPEDTPVTIDVLENDTDPQGQPLTITGADVPEEQGTVEIVGNELVFTPAPDFNGGPVEISYTVEDPDGNTDEGTATVTVTPVNDAPVAEDDADTTGFNTPVTVNLLANDSDVDGDTLTVTEATVPADQGTLGEVQPDGTVEFTPAEDFTGEATISYTIRDEEGLTDSAEHVVTVEDNSAPVAVDDEATTPEDTPVIVDLLGNDEEPNGDELTLVEATVPEEQGTLEDNGDGTVTFTPAPDFNGPATITYTVADPQGVEDEGEAVVTVTPVNDAPDAVDDRDVTDLDTPVTIDLLDNDTDPENDPLLVTDVTVPADQGEIVDNGDGTATFTPTPGFVGDATVTYTIRDTEGETDTAEHVITVSDPDDAPTAVDDVAETDEDTPVTIDAIDNDTDPTDDPLTITDAFVPEEQGTVEVVDNQLVFTPAEDFNGPAEITYVIEDPDGNADRATVRVEVVPVNDAPDAVDDVATTEEDTPVVIDLVDNDSDPEGDTLTVTAVSVPPEQGTVVNNGDGTATFTPAPNFNGEATVTYTIADSDDVEDTAVHVIDVTPINDAPDAVDDSDETDEGTPVVVDLLANDTDPEDDTLTVIEASVPEEQGTLEPNEDGTFTFTPAEDFVGEATITYTIEDEGGLRDTAEHTVTVNDVDNDPPVAVDDTATTPEDTPVTIDLRGNDTDPDDPLTDLVISGLTVDPAEGTVVDNEDGTVTFTPAPNFNGEATIGYTITDPDGGSDTGEATVGVTPVNDAPVAVDDTTATDQGVPVTVAVLTNDTDVDGDPLRVVDASSPNGTVVVNPNNTVTFTPNPGFIGSANISYTISDRPAGDPDALTDEGNITANVLIPCFTPGTKIATPKGERLVEELQVGDRVITRDNGIQEIRWVGARDMSGAELEKAAHLKPVLIQSGALGNELPERDMMVSPNHRILVANDKTALYFEEREVLVAAKHLTGLEGVDVVDVSHTTYIHIMFDQHEVILSDGSWTESFQPGDMSLAGVGNAQRQEILELFPELATEEGMEAYASARRSLKKHEAKLITK